VDNFVDLVVLLSVAVVVVALFERLKMPSIIAYLYVGLAVGPHGLGLIQDAESIRLLGGVGLIFFLFTAGLELPIPKIMAMGWISLGLGGGQVLLTMIAVAIVAFVFGFSWIEGIVIGSAMASSATALVIKQLKDQNELEEKHARISMVVTVFQDVLSIPILVLIPVLALEGGGSLAVPVFWVIVRILLVFSIFFILGRMFLRPLFHEIASTQSTELFTLTVLLVIALSAWVSHVADLSLVLGTFLAGMVLGETEFRHQVESDIRPFQDVLLGLFFITIGMLLDITLVFKEWQIIMMVSFAFMVAKGGIVALLMYLGKIGTRVESVRAGILLCQGSEFGFAVMLLAISNNILNERTSQIVLASLLITMVVSPVLIRFNGKIAPFVLRLLRLNDVRAPERESVRDEFASGIRRAKDHALILGYGPSGQNLARILEMEGVPYVASDLDPERVAQARAAGQMVMFGDASRTSILEIMSLDKAKLVVITMDHPEHVTRAIRNVRSLRPDVPICVRAKGISISINSSAKGRLKWFPKIWRPV
jgi:CPA2 family monovalent cation:H+ antiporter-2